MLEYGHRAYVDATGVGHARVVRVIFSVRYRSRLRGVDKLFGCAGSCDFQELLICEDLDWQWCSTLR